MHFVANVFAVTQSVLDKGNFVASQKVEVASAAAGNVFNHRTVELVTRLRRTCLAVNFDKEAFDGVAALSAVQARMRKAYETEHAAFMARHGNDKEPAEASL